MRPTYGFSELPVLHSPALARLTDDDFYQLCQDKPQLQLERDANHNIIMPPALPNSSENGLEAAYQLKHWSRTMASEPGHAYESSAGFRLNNGAIRAPDAARLSHTRRLVAQKAGGFLATCPEFVVEILWPSDRLAVTQAKPEEYLANGALPGFLLGMGTETAYVYRPGQPVETGQSYDRELGGEPVLPGFALDLQPLRRPFTS